MLVESVAEQRSLLTMILAGIYDSSVGFEDSGDRSLLTCFADLSGPA